MVVEYHLCLYSRDFEDPPAMSEALPPRHDVPAVFQKTHASASRLIHLIPDQLAEAVPDHVLFSFPISAELQDGFRDVSCRCFANGINRAAWYLRDLLGPPTRFDTVAYMGSSKLLYCDGVRD